MRSCRMVIVIGVLAIDLKGQALSVTAAMFPSPAVSSTRHFSVTSNRAWLSKSSMELVRDVAWKTEATGPVPIGSRAVAAVHEEHFHEWRTAAVVDTFEIDVP